MGRKAPFSNIERFPQQILVGHGHDEMLAGRLWSTKLTRYAGDVCISCLVMVSLKSGGTKYYGGNISPLQSCFKVKFQGESGSIPSIAKVATSHSLDLM